jgi:hypothetical protein
VRSCERTVFQKSIACRAAASTSMGLCFAGWDGLKPSMCEIGVNHRSGTSFQAPRAEEDAPVHVGSELAL